MFQLSYGPASKKFKCTLMNTALFQTGLKSLNLSKIVLMKAATIDSRITDCLRHLNMAQKKTLLSVARSLAQAEDLWWQKVETAAAGAIETGLQQAGKGQLTDHKEVVKKHSRWLKQ
jgi:predicted transcriptional regulator